MTEIPKIIYSWWGQGIENAPDIVVDCWHLWQKMNPEYKCIMFTPEMVEEVKTKIGGDFDKLPFQAKSDVLRVYFVNKTGGIWVDAAVIPVKPLRMWLPELTKSGFFAFHDPLRGRQVGSWFLASKKQHKIIYCWSNAILDYWQKDRILQTNKYQLDENFRGNVSRFLMRLLPVKKRKKIYIPKNVSWSVDEKGGGKYDLFPYFWVHYLFENLFETNSKFRKSWAEVVKHNSYKQMMIRHSKKWYSGMTKLEFESLIKNSNMQKLYWNNKPNKKYLDTLFSELEKKYCV